MTSMGFFKPAIPITNPNLGVCLGADHRFRRGKGGGVTWGEDCESGRTRMSAKGKFTCAFRRIQKSFARGWTMKRIDACRCWPSLGRSRNTSMFTTPEMPLAIPVCLSLTSLCERWRRVMARADLSRLELELKQRNMLGIQPV